MNSIECKNLSKVFHDGSIKVDVFDDINFSVPEGEMVAIVGASGVGKSTLLQLLGGLDKPTSGQVIVAGKDITTLSERAKGHLRNHYLGFVYQFHHLLPEFNALENVCMPLLIRRMSSKKAIQKASDIIELVGLSNRAKHRIGELSGGERQRIAIARALVTDPKCVLADEPTGNLDKATADQVFDLMLQLKQTLGTAFVVVTHNELIAKRMDRVLKLEVGKLVDYEII